MNDHPTDKRVEPYGYVICLFIFLSYVLAYFHRLCPAVIALEMQETFRVSGTLLGVLGSAYFYPYAIMQLPTGLLVDSWGPRKTVSSFLLLAALGSVVMGLASDLSVAIVGRVLVGVGVSTLFVSNFKLLAEWFTPRKSVIMGGIFMAMGGVGALSSAAPLAWASTLFGWRMTLVGVGLISMVMALLVYAFVRNRPSDMDLAPVNRTCQETGRRGESLFEGVKLVVSSGRFWPISIWTFFATGMSFAFGGLWGGPYLIQIYGLSKTAAAGVLSMFALALIFGSPILCWAANRVGRRPIFLGCSLTLIAISSVFYLFTRGLPLPLLYLLFFCFFLAGAANGPVAATVTKELFPLPIAGTSMGTVNLFPFFGGAFYQVGVGKLLAWTGKVDGMYALWGYRLMFMLYLIGAVISFIACLFLQETLSRPEPEREESLGWSVTDKEPQTFR